MNNNNKTNWGQFFPLISVFFFFGFITASNAILIPVFKNAFDLEQWQSMMVQFAFYIAYTVGSLAYILISWAIKSDLINKIGYKNGLIYGLLISASGTLLFYPAANNHSFLLMIAGLFIVGLGFSLQQIVVNPLSIAMGSKETGTQRLTLAGGINNFGATIGPLIVSYAIFGSATSPNIIPSIESVKIPYLCVGAAFILVALLLKFSALPRVTDSNMEPSDESKIQTKTSVFQFPQLVFGMIALFLYVGVEVSTESNLPEYMKSYLGFQTKDVAPYISLYWASLMIGRWAGAIEAFDVKAGTQKFLKFLAPYLAFAVFLAVNAIAKHSLEPFYNYGWVIIILILADMVSKGKPDRMLLIFSILGILAIIIGMSTKGMISVYAFISVGLFCSTLWPCIFALAINGLGKYTNQGSSFLIMMIMGGGLVSLLQAYIADVINVKFSYIIGIFCFAYLIFYALIVKKIFKNQGIKMDEK